MSVPRNMENEIVAAIRRIMRAVELHSRQLLDAHGLTGPQLAVMQVVARLETATVTSVARAVYLGRATVTRVLSRLEEQGFVKRTRSEHDRRSVNVAVTERGRSILKDAPSLLQDRFRDELSRLEEWEQTTILSTLQRIAAMMDAESIPASPVLMTGPLAEHDEAEKRKASETGLVAERPDEEGDNLE